MSDWFDPSQSVRPGEELDLTALAAYLTAHLAEASGSLVVEQFPGGYSNLTYLLRLGAQELVLRRPPFGAAIKSAHDMLREYTVLSRLQGVYDKAPRPLLYCEDETVLGAPFYVMERVKGIILRPQMAPAMTPPAPLMRRIAGALVDSLVELHQVDLEAAGLQNFGKPVGYTQRQIEGWARRYLAAKTDNIPEIEQTAAWLAGHMPPDNRAALIHNDYKYDNLVLNPADWGRIIAVLDWEMATVGDPLMDLGTSLGYWVQADDPPILQMLALSPTMLPGNLSRVEVVERYAQASGRSVDDIVFYYVYGLFKIAVIVQQIYHRYKLGYTHDPRFAGLIHAVQVCGQTALQAIARRRMDHLFA